MHKPHSRQPGRKSLRFESLEDRRLLAAVSIANAMISEPGDTSVFVSQGSGGLSGPRDLTIGPDGNLYVADSANNNVLRYNSSTGQFIDTFVAWAPRKPGELTRPFGLAFGPDGDLYVGSTNTDSILHYRGPTKPKPGSFVNEFVPTGFEGLNDPSGLAFGSDGNLYVTNRITYIDTTPTGTGEILRFAGPLNANPGSGLPSPGNSGATFVPQGTGGLTEPFDLVFGPDSNLYVANQSTFSVLRFDATDGGLIDVFVPEGRGDLVCPRGIAFDQEGQLYVADSVSGAIHRYNAQGQFIDNVALPGVSGLAAPHGLAFDSQGSLLIGDAVYSSIARYDQGVTVTLSAASSTPVSVQYAMADNTADQSDYHNHSGVVTFLPGQTSRRILLATKDDLQSESAEAFTVQLSNPVGATLLQSSASVTITDDDATRQVVIAAGSETEGDHTAHFRGPFASDLPGHNFSGDVYFGLDGLVYASPGGGRTQGAINRYDATTGAFIDEFIAPGRINGVRDVRIRDGYLYVGSSYTDEVLRFDATTGAFDGVFVTAGSGGLGATLGMDFGPDFNDDGIPELYVAGRDSFTVGRYDGATGAPLGSYVTPGSGGLRYPGGLTFDPTNTFLYVASNGTGQILKYDAWTGAFVGVAAGTNISNVHDVKFGADGLLYVASGGNNRILRFNTAGQYVDDYVPAGSGGLSNPNSLVFGPDGDLYVSSFGNSDILRYGTESEIVLNVSISSPSSLPVKVDYSTGSGSATAGIDFTQVSGTVFFPPGVTSKTITVPVLDDLADEDNEMLTVTLSNATGAVITGAQSIGTILDNEAPPTKFYVVNDAATNITYEYSQAGAAIENYSLDSGNTSPRGAASTAAGDKVWVIDANKRVYVYDNSGGLLGSWVAGSLPANAIVEGIATNGTDVWIVDARSDKVFRYAGAGSLLSGSASAINFNLASGNTNPKDIVTGGTHLWVVDDSTTDKVFKYTLSGALLGSWTINSGGGSPTGITIDPADVSNIWIVDNGTDLIYQYDGAAARTNQSQGAGANFALAPGNTNPQGIADPPVAMETATTMSATAFVIDDVSSVSTTAPSRNYTPSRRPPHAAVRWTDSFENLNLLQHAEPAAAPTASAGRVRPASDSVDKTILDAAFATLADRWSTLAADTLTV